MNFQNQVKSHEIVLKESGGFYKGKETENSRPSNGSSTISFGMYYSDKMEVLYTRWIAQGVGSLNGGYKVGVICSLWCGFL
jgi:hypothetical protein